MKQENLDSEKKRARWILVCLFLGTIFFTFLSIIFREFPKWIERLSKTDAVVSKQFIQTSTPTPTPKLTKEKKEIEKILEPLRGEYGVYFEDLTTKDSFEINGSRKFTAASLIKLPVMLAFYKEAEKGNINLDQIYKLQATDIRGGAGSLQYKPAGYSISYRKMIELMGQQSDNTAFNIISRTLGATKIQAVIENLGMRNTSFAENETSPEDIGIFFRKLYSEKVLTNENRNELLNFLTNTIWEDRIPAGLPKGIKVAHKIGTEVGVISDAGIIFAPKPYILVIISENVNEIEAKKVLPEISKKIFELRE